VSHAVVTVTTTLGEDDPRGIHVHELSDPSGRPGRLFRVAQIVEQLVRAEDGNGSHTVLLEGPVTTAVGGYHAKWRGHLVFRPTTLRESWIDDSGLSLPPRLAPYVRGADALRALAEGRTATAVLYVDGDGDQWAVIGDTAHALWTGSLAEVRPLAEVEERYGPLLPWRPGGES
jgi:hypothetical protein